MKNLKQLKSAIVLTSEEMKKIEGGIVARVGNLCMTKCQDGDCPHGKICKQIKGSQDCGCTDNIA